jgi:hypothetical protein
MSWWRIFVYRTRVRRVISVMKAAGVCTCEMCLGAEMRHGIGEDIKL